jgi:TonB family protein
MSALADVLGPAIYNLLAWTAQAAVLALVAAMIGRLMPHPRGRLAFLQTVLLVGLMLPAVEPWSKPAAHSAGTVAVSMGPVTVLDGAPSRFHLQWKPNYLLWVAAAGAGVRLLWILVGFARLRAYRNSAARLDRPPVPFERGIVNWYVSEIVTSPVTFGWTTASILLPARVMELPDDLREAIACHELIHVERRDWLFVLGEEILRALLWFQPGIWILLAEIQLAREQVVDSEVIRLMRDRERYLDALLAVATYKFQSDLAPAPLFLKKRHLAARVATLLKETRMSKARICASFAGACSAAVAAAVLSIAFFPLQSTAQVPAQVNAVVADGPGVTVEAGAPLMHRIGVFRPSGVTATGTVMIEATLDSKGEVSDARVLSGPEELRRGALQSVLGWHYAAGPSRVQATVSFGPLPAPQSRAEASIGERTAVTWPTPPATLKSVQIIGASDELAQQVRAVLPIHEGDQIDEGSMRQMMGAVRQIDSHFTESLSLNENNEATLRLLLAAPRLAGSVTTIDRMPPPAIVPPAPQSAPSSTPQRIRVGGNVQQANLITKVTPAYPALAKDARIQGVVHFAVAIGKDGTVQNVEVLSGHPLLVPAAMEAVKQWIYRPTLLNGNPVEVITTVDVTFTLSQ